jgi:hypothetical protein
VLIADNIQFMNFNHYDLGRVSGEQVILPIWHNITKKEVIEYSPSLADKLARSTSTNTVEEIASEIVEVIQSVGDNSD